MREMPAIIIFHINYNVVAFVRRVCVFIQKIGEHTLIHNISKLNGERKRHIKGHKLLRRTNGTYYLGETNVLSFLHNFQYCSWSCAISRFLYEGRIKKGFELSL